MSHKISSDMTNEIFGRISCKSGTFKNTKNKNELVLSSSRTTKYKTLNEKIDFIKIDKEDCFFCLTNSKKNNSYRLVYFESNTLNINETIWSESKAGWKGSRKGLDITITKSMSDQIWYYLDNKEIENVYDIKSL